MLKLRRKIGPGAAILFKGSGFYQTDYRSESYKKAAQADKSVRASRPKSSPGDSDEPSPSRPSSTKSEPAKPGRHSPKERDMMQGRCPICSKNLQIDDDRRSAVVSVLLASDAG